MKTSARLLALVVVAGLAAGPDLHAAETGGEQVAENFRQADANGDGALTLSEFRTLIDLNAEDGIGRAGMVKRFGRYGQAFGHIDANGDGLVTQEEMRAVAAEANG